MALALTGNEAAAYAAKLAKVKAGVFFPIGPADEVLEVFQELIDKGEVKEAEVVQMENEKAVLSTQIALARLGVRSMFATCGEGLVWPAAEIKYASGSRLPLMIVNPSRAVGPPTTVQCDHGDFVMQRDMGWLQFYCEDSQDIIDTILQAYKISEDPQVSLPVIVGYDGWETSHSTFRVDLPDETIVDSFLHDRMLSKDYLEIDWYSVCKQRRLQPPPGKDYMENKFSLKNGYEIAKEKIQEVGGEYHNLFGRDFYGLFEEYYVDGAECVLLTMGNMTKTIRFIVEALRKEGCPIGMVKLRSFRPFPGEQLYQALNKVKTIAVIERNVYSAVFDELRSVFYGKDKQPIILGRVIGIGGRDISYEHIFSIASEAIKAAQEGKAAEEMKWVGLTKEVEQNYVSTYGE